MSIGFYSRRRSGVLISRLTNDVEALDQLVTDGVVTLFQSTLTVIGTIVILFWLDAELAALTMLAVPLLLLGSLGFRIASADAYRITRERIALITAYLQETLSGVRVVRAFGREARHLKQFAKLNDDNRAANMKTVNLNAAYFPAVELLSALVTVAILLYGGYQAISGQVTVGVLVAFITALNTFFDPIQQLSQLYTTYQSGMAALDKIFELLDEQPDLVDAPDAVELGRLRGEIAFEDVTFRYAGQDEWALCDTDLHVPPGQTVALVGATGAGKSTLAKLVARFYDPDRGRVLVDGHDLRTVTSQSLRSQMGIVPQEAFLFSGTVRENIAFGKPEATLTEVREAAAAVGADELHHRARGRLRHRGGRARRAALGRPAPAHRLRPRPDRRPAHPRARRGHLERRHAHRGPDRARPAAPAGRPHGDRDRAPALDHPPGRAHRRARARPRGRAGHARRAASRPRAPTTGCTATGPSRRPREGRLDAASGVLGGGTCRALSHRLRPCWRRPSAPHAAAFGRRVGHVQAGGAERLHGPAKVRSRRAHVSVKAVSTPSQGHWGTGIRTPTSTSRASRAAVTPFPKGGHEYRNGDDRPYPHVLSWAGGTERSQNGV